VTRLIDLVVGRIAPRVTASACSGSYYCDPPGLSSGYWFRFCCPQTGCDWTLIQPFCR
jgi:hypothetical protein